MTIWLSILGDFLIYLAFLKNLQVFSSASDYEKLPPKPPDFRVGMGRERNRGWRKAGKTPHLRMVNETESGIRTLLRVCLLLQKAFSIVRFASTNSVVIGVSVELTRSRIKS